MQTLLKSTVHTLAQPQRRMSLVSLIPLIDVVFILLVFFMSASSFLDWRTITVHTVMPSANGILAESLDKPLLVKVKANELQLHGQTVLAEQLIGQLKQVLVVDAQTVVYVQPVSNTALQPVIRLLDQLTGAGIERIQLVRDSHWQPDTQN